MNKFALCVVVRVVEIFQRARAREFSAFRFNSIESLTRRCFYWYALQWRQ